MCLSRRDNYMRGPTHADNNLKPEFCCGMCMTLAQLALHLGPRTVAARWMRLSRGAASATLCSMPRTRH